MAFIDANYILRYLLEDHPKQFLIVKEVIENNEISLSDFILAEVVYVLEKVYSVPRKDIRIALESLLEYRNLILENKNVVLRSFQIYSENKIDFTDALLIAYHKESSNIVLHTFDKKILKIISAL